MRLSDALCVCVCLHVQDWNYGSEINHQFSVTNVIFQERLHAVRAFVAFGKLHLILVDTVSSVRSKSVNNLYIWERFRDQVGMANHSASMQIVYMESVESFFVVCYAYISLVETRWIPTADKCIRLTYLQLTLRVTEPVAWKSLHTNCGNTRKQQLRWTSLVFMKLCIVFYYWL